MDPRFQKKFLALKISRKSTNLTLKTVLNEQLNIKTSNNPPKKYKNALIRPYYILYSARQGVQRSDGALP